MAKAWNMVPTAVVLNGWLSTKLMSPFQMDEIRGIKERVKQEVKPAFRPQVGSSLLIEKSQEQQHAIVAKEKGEDWLRTSSSILDLCKTSSEDVSNRWDDENIGLVLEDICQFKELEVFNDEDLEEFMKDEEGVSVCQEVRAENAVDVAVDAALNVAKNSAELSQEVEVFSEAEQEEEEFQQLPKASLKEFQLSAEALQKQVKLLVAENHDICDSFGCDLPSMLDLQIENVKAFRKKYARQSRIIEFLRK